MDSMTITLPLEPSADELVRQAVDQVLNAASNVPSAPKKSMYGLLAKYGPGPSDDEIDENRREMFQGFAEDHP
jgi:hypothetical protein